MRSIFTSVIASVSAVTLAVGLAASRPAQAEPWYRGEAGTRRLKHLAFTAGGGALYAISETLAKPALAPDQCRWCTVDALDEHARNALRWNAPDRAVTLSNVTVVATPVLMVGLTALAASSGAEDGERLARFIDDAIPIAETFVGGQLVNQSVKFAFGRQRPLVHFQSDSGFVASQDDNLSFFSAHASQTFGLAVSAGVVAHRRGSPLEPVIWATGLSLATATSYFRVAGDKHYLTDVLAGAVWGTTAGLLIPRLTHALPPNVSVVPQGDGVAVLGTF